MKFHISSCARIWGWGIYGQDPDVGEKASYFATFKLFKRSGQLSLCVCVCVNKLTTGKGEWGSEVCEGGLVARHFWRDPFLHLTQT